MALLKLLVDIKENLRSLELEEVEVVESLEVEELEELEDINCIFIILLYNIKMSSDNDSVYSDSDTESVINENNLINELTHSERYSAIFNILVQAKVLFLGRNDRNVSDEDRVGRQDRAKHIIAESLLENGWAPNINRRRKDDIILNEVEVALVYLQGMSRRASQANRLQIQNYIEQIRQHIGTYLNNVNNQDNDQDSDQASDLGDNQDFDVGDFGSDNGSEPGTPRQPYNAQGRRKRKTKKSRKSKKARKSKKSRKTRRY
jgi:hypothetical protein